MASKIQELARWKAIYQGQCAYRSSNHQTGKMRCRHLFTNTAECHYVGCPIVQPKFVALQRSHDTIYLVNKNPNAKEFNEIWTDVELPTEKSEALTLIQDATKGLSNTLKEATLAKFEHVFDIATTVKDILKTEENLEDLEDTIDEKSIDLEDSDNTGTKGE